MRLIISGGGTGGHIYPAIALYKRLQVAIPDCETLYIGSKHGYEHVLVNDTAVSFAEISVKGLNRRDIRTWPSTIFNLIKSFFETYKIIKKFKPDLVIGMGGYVTFPVVFTAHFLRIDTMIHEQNSVPGFTTKKLSRYADRVLISYKESIEFFDKPNLLYYTGNPVRQEFMNVDRAKSREKYGLRENQKLIVSMAGSNGAYKFNELSMLIDEFVKKDENLRYINIVGKYAEANFKEVTKNHQFSDRTTIIDYHDDMPGLMAAADLMICRAGAITLAEMAIVGLPGILIPSPYVVGDHQKHNAISYQKEGSCVMLEEDTITDELFNSTLAKLVYSDGILEKMRKCHGADYRENALNTIVSLVYDYQLR